MSRAGSPLYRRSWYGLLGILSLFVVLGIEVGVPAYTGDGLQILRRETIQVLLTEGWWKLRSRIPIPHHYTQHRDYGRTLLHYTVAVNSTEGTWLLVTLGANRNARTILRMTPLHYAWGEQSEGVVKVLLNHGADPNARDFLGNTRLHKGVILPVAALLLDQGADPNTRNVDGRTPLHDVRNSAIAALLLDYGADPNVRDDLGLLPLDVALLQGATEVVKILREHS